jgi:superfamily II DNA or RNA helicase
VWATVAGKLFLCDKLMAIPDPKLSRDTAVRLRLNDGLKHFFDPDTGMLPAGLVHRLERRLLKRGHAVCTRCDEPPFQFDPTPVDYLIGKDLRDYQVEAIDLSLKEGRGLLWMATNSGKSAVIAGICGRLVREAGAKVIVAVPNAYLLKQTSKDIRTMLGPDVAVGLAGDGERKLTCDVLVATWQTLVNGCARGRLPAEDAGLAKWLAVAQGVIIDETHHAASDAYQRILQTATAAKYRFGCTGSLDKGDKRAEGERKEGSDDAARMHRWMVEAFIGPLLYRVDNAYLIEQGHSAVPRFFIVRDRAAFGPIVKTPRPKATGRPINPYNHVFEFACVRDEKWHRSVAAVVAHLIEQGRPPFVFSHSVKLLGALSRALDRLGVAHKVLHGDHAVSNREAVVKEFERDGGFAILASSIFDEGASIPAIRSVVFAGARKSPVELLQRIGRGVRKKVGEANDVLVVDFDPCHSTMLHDHFEARLASYRAEGFKVKYVDDLTQVSQLII